MLMRMEINSPRLPARFFFFFFDAYPPLPPLPKRKRKKTTKTEGKKSSSRQILRTHVQYIHIVQYILNITYIVPM